MADDTTYKYYCRKGHERTLENTYIDNRGYRLCTTCANATAMRSYYKIGKRTRAIKRNTPYTIGKNPNSHKNKKDSKGRYAST